jgi:Bacterial Ig-like domain (group 3)
VTATITPQSSESVSVNYNGDNNYGGSTSSTGITVNIPGFSLVVPGPLVVTVGQSGSLQISVVPASNTPSAVTLSCYGGLPNGYACSFQPNPVNLANGATATATLTLSPAPAGQAILHTTLVRKPMFGTFGSNRHWPLTVATALLTSYLLLWPRRSTRFRPALVCGLACVLSLLGCGGGGGGSIGGTSGGGGQGGAGGGGGTPQLSATATSLSVSAPTVASGSPLTLTAKVTGPGNPTGTVDFNIVGSWGGQANLVAGTATVTANALFPGLYQVTATYNGDASNSPSTSAPVKEGVTGSTSAVVIGQTGSVRNNTSVTITVQ